MFKYFKKLSYAFLYILGDKKAHMDTIKYTYLHDFKTLEKYDLKSDDLFITVTLKPFLYTESFRNQYNRSIKELKLFLQHMDINNYIYAVEATKLNNVHYHILAKSKISKELITDAIKNCTYLGNTLIKTNLEIHQTHTFNYNGVELTLPKIKWYLIKDWDDTDKILNAFYNVTVVDVIKHHNKPPKIKKLYAKVRTSLPYALHLLDDGIIDDFDQLFN